MSLLFYSVVGPEGAQSLCDPWSCDGGFPPLLASLLPMVPDHHLHEGVGDHDVWFDDYHDRLDGNMWWGGWD